MANTVNFVITSLGEAALVNAAHDGTQAIKLDKVQFGTSKYTATTSQTALKTVVATAQTVGGTQAGDNVIHVTAQDASAMAYDINEVGIFATLDDNSSILFAVYSVGSNGSPIMRKTAVSSAYLAFDLLITADGADSITFGDTNFVDPPATTSTSGVAMLASSEEVLVGTNATKIVTPATLQAKTATISRYGLTQLSNSIDSSSEVLAATPKTVKTAYDLANLALPKTTASSTYATKIELIARLPTGIILPFAGSSIPDGWLICNGAAVSRTTYADLFQAIGTTWGAGNGSTTFNLPDARNRVLQGSGRYAVGSSIEAGLPNISCSKLFNDKRNEPELKEAIARGKAKGVNYASNALFKLIDKGNLGAIIFYLKSQGGWSEESKLKVENTQPIQIVVKNDLED